MAKNNNILYRIDWYLVLCYLALVTIGIFNIYSVSTSDSELSSSIFSPSNKSGLQLLWFCVSIVAIVMILFVLSPKIYTVFSWWIFFGCVLFLIAVIAIGTEINGSKSWLVLGPIRFQPSEIAKIGTSIALAAFMGSPDFRDNSRFNIPISIAIIGIPVALILLQGDIGTLLVFCGFAIILYREWMSGWYLMLALLMLLLFVITIKFSPFAAILSLIGLINLLRGFYLISLRRALIGNIIFITAFSFLPSIMRLEFFSFLNILPASTWLIIVSAIIIVHLFIKVPKKKLKHLTNMALAFTCGILMVLLTQFLFDSVFKQHHRDRIETLLDIKEDLHGAGYNIHQSKIAIGSGEAFGKGYMQGTQTKFNFVPEQSTDFIFCTIGEEWGFVGSSVIVILFFFLIVWILYKAEKNEDATTRIYGYCVATCFFIHFFVNIGMTIGLMPVVGIPLPFISYGGSSFLSFSILLFIFIRLDAEH